MNAGPNTACGGKGRKRPLRPTLFREACVTFQVFVLNPGRKARMLLSTFYYPLLALTDFARLRLETISFFLLVLLGSGLAAGWLWNCVGRECFRLPRLSYLRALGLVLLWGLLVVVLLTMMPARGK